MKALIIGSQTRYEKYLPHSSFTDSVEKSYYPLQSPIEDIAPADLTADFMAVDAIARVPASLIHKMTNLKIIHSEGVAYNGIDCQAAREQGVYVCNNRGINADAVAEQTILLMLGLLRHVVEGDAEVRQARQIQMKERLMVSGITELGECHVGLIGFGDIAKSVARFLQPFGCQVSYYATRRKSPEIEREYHVSWMELPEMMRTCDFISIHVPVTPETTGMIDKNFLQGMRRDAYLINTARGEIVDHEALRQALAEGWIAGAGLDTLAPEPVRKDNPLLNLPVERKGRVLFSPHIAGITTQTFRRAHRNIWTAFEKVSRQERPDNIVNGLV